MSAATRACARDHAAARLVRRQLTPGLPSLSSPPIPAPRRALTMHPESFFNARSFTKEDLVKARGGMFVTTNYATYAL